MKAIHRVVRERIGDSLVDRILNDAPVEDLQLWAAKPPRRIKTKTILLALYKDITFSSYASIHRELRRAGSVYDVSLRSLQHNIKSARLVLRTWAEGTLTTSSS